MPTLKDIEIKICKHCGCEYRETDKAVTGRKLRVKIKRPTNPNCPCCGKRVDVKSKYSCPYCKLDFLIRGEKKRISVNTAFLKHLLSCRKKPNLKTSKCEYCGILILHDNRVTHQERCEKNPENVHFQDGSEPVFYAHGKIPNQRVVTSTRSRQSTCGNGGCTNYLPESLDICFECACTNK